MPGAGEGPASHRCRLSSWGWSASRTRTAGAASRKGRRTCSRAASRRALSSRGAACRGECLRDSWSPSTSSRVTSTGSGRAVARARSRDSSRATSWPCSACAAAATTAPPSPSSCSIASRVRRAWSARPWATESSAACRRSQPASQGSWPRARSEIDSRRAVTGSSGPAAASRWARTPEVTVRHTGSTIRLRQVRAEVRCCRAAATSSRSRATRDSATDAAAFRLSGAGGRRRRARRRGSPPAAPP